MGLEAQARGCRVNAVERFNDTDIKLAEHAEVIRALDKRAVRDIIEIGQRLIDAKGRCGHGRFGEWLEREFAGNGRTAQGFMLVAETAGKSANFADLNVPVSGLYLLAAPSAPADVIEAVADASAKGENLTLAEVKRMIAEASGAEQRKELVALFKVADKVKPISHRKIAKALNVDESTVRADSAGNPAPGEKKPNKNSDGSGETAGFPAPPCLPASARRGWSRAGRQTPPQSATSAGPARR